MPASKNVTGLQDLQKHQAKADQIDSSKPQKLDEDTKRKVLWVAAAVFGALALCGAAALFAPSLLGVTVVLLDLGVVIPTGCATGVAGIATATCLYTLSKKKKLASVTSNNPCGEWKKSSPLTEKILQNEMYKDIGRGDGEFLIFITNADKKERPLGELLKDIPQEERGNYVLTDLLPKLLKDRSDLHKEREGNQEDLVSRISQSLVQRGLQSFQEGFVIPQIMKYFKLSSNACVSLPYGAPITRELVIPSNPADPVKVRVNLRIENVFACEDGTTMKELNRQFTAQAEITFDPRGAEHDTMTLLLLDGLEGPTPAQNEAAAE